MPGFGNWSIMPLMAFLAVMASLPGSVAPVRAETAPATVPDAADDLYRQAVELVYASARITDDTRKGVELLEQAASQGSSSALIELGELYLYGKLLPRDLAKARSYFDRAAASGDWSGLAQYGMMQMWSERDWREGQTLLEQAAEQGSTWAWVTLAEGAMYGYLGGGTASRKKYAAYAEKAAQAGETGIALLESQRYQWGIMVRADGRMAVDVLRKAADAGNRDAAIALINLLRDGNGLNVRRDRQAAREAMETYSKLLKVQEIWQLDRALEAALATGPAQFEALSDKVLAPDALVSGDFGALLMKANANAAIFVLQKKLAADGADVGRPDGFAGPRTIAAMRDACLRILPSDLCDDSVMRSDVISKLLVLP